MSKTTDQVLIVPGESGWEVWTSQTDGGFALQNATDSSSAAELTEIPGGDLTMLFAVRSLTAVPMRVTSDDDALFPDLAELHAERLGLRPDPLAGQLTDVFVVAREAENTALLSVFLTAPSDGDLPPKGPKSFDLSARAFPVDGETLTIWREFGRWVFAIFHQGKLIYCQATAIDAEQPDASLAREIRLALIQLSMQGLHVEPDQVLVWSSDETVNPSDLRSAFKATVEVLPRPAPILPDPLSKLLPADVRAARRDAIRRRNIILGIAAVVLLYLGLMAWSGYGLWKASSETKELLALAEASAPEGEAYSLHIGKWDELSNAIDLNNSPVDVLSRIAACIPPRSGLRLKIADISAESITLRGEAPQLQAVNTFSLKLSKNANLSRFNWQTPEPNQSTRGWEFTFSGEVPIVDSQP